MKKIEDYLNLYMPFEYNFYGYKYKVIGFKDCGHFFMFWHEHGFFDVLKQDFKLQLCRLSDITEEEKTNVQSLMIEYANLSFTHEQMHGKMVGNGKSFYYAEFDEEGNFMCSVSSPIENLPLKAVPYLLSKHFDLFNLIPEGLAIDKNTVK